MDRMQNRESFEEAVRTEAERTRAELSGKLGQAREALLPLVAGALVVLFGLELLTVAGVLLLGRVMPPWIAALLLGASSMALGALIMALGARRALSKSARSGPREPRARGESRAA